MGILLPLLLFFLAAAMFGAVKLGFISSQTLQMLANVGAVVAAGAAIVVIPWSINSDRNNKHESTISTDTDLLMISSPKNGAEVGQFVAVKGYTKYTGLHHYIVVGPQTGTVWVTDGPLLIQNSGHWTGRAQLGTGEVGEGEFFLIHTVATQSELSIGDTSMEEVKNSSSAVVTINVQRRTER